MKKPWQTITEIWLRCYRNAGSDTSDWTSSSSNNRSWSAVVISWLLRVFYQTQPELKPSLRCRDHTVRLGKFLPQLSDVPEPLRNLTKEQNQFIWSQVHQDAFNKLTQLFSEPPLLRYYDLEEEVTIETDASDYELGAVLLQAGRPVVFASRTMTETERRYSQIEKEYLALVEKITAVTDHKPLETILAKSINSAPKRLQRMMLRLQTKLCLLILRTWMIDCKPGLT